MATIGQDGQSGSSPLGGNQGSYSADTPGEHESQQHEVKQEALHSAEKIRAEARRTAEALKTRALDSMRETATRQKETAASELHTLSAALASAANELEGHSQLPMDRFMRRASESLDTLSENLRGRDMTNVVEQMGRYTREQPLMIFGGAVFTGFLLARLLKEPVVSSESTYSQA